VGSKTTVTHDGTNRPTAGNYYYCKRARGEQVTDHLPVTVPVQRGGPPGGCPRALRERWRLATLAAGWPFPGDWELPAVDAVCEAAAEGRDWTPALSLLGRARAASGAGLAETLQDLAALHAVLRHPGNARPAVDDPDTVPTRLVRATAIGWADVTLAEVGMNQVIEPLTGLATAGYLRTRLGEIYRSARAEGRPVGDRHALVLVALDLRRVHGWTRLVPMLLAAEAIREVFDGGQTHAAVGPSVAAVLCRRDHRLPARIRLLRSLVGELLAADPDASSAGPPRVWLERLPDDHAAACDLVARLGHQTGH
jgi:hypothetical protein